MNEQAPLDEQTVSPRPKMSPQNRLRLGLLILIAVLLAVVAGGYAYLYTQQSKELQKLQAATDAPLGKEESRGTEKDAATDPEASAAKVTYSESVQVLQIKEWGVELNLPLHEGQDKFIYRSFNKNQAGVEKLSISRNGLAADCHFGFLVRGPKNTLSAQPNTQGPAGPVYIATMQNFEYGYDHSRSACAALNNKPGEAAYMQVLQGAAYNLRPISE